MRRLFVWGCVVALVLLTLANAWWQHRYWAGRLEASEQQREVLLRRLRMSPSGDVVSGAGLANCRAELEVARQHLQDLASRADDVAARCLAEREGLRAERDALLGDRQTYRDGQAPGPSGEVVPESRSARGSAGASATRPGGGHMASECSHRLQSAVRELYQLRHTAHGRVLSAQASAARLAVGGRALAARIRAVQGASAARLALAEARLNAALNLHVKQLERVAADLGFHVGAKEIQAAVQKRLDSELSVPAIEGGAPPLDSRPDVEDDEDVGESQPRPKYVPLLRKAFRSTTTRQFGHNPVTCVAAVVPFRGRWEHLKTFYLHISRFLASPEAQHLCWSFYIVEQFDTALFNRGWLFNVGFAMAGLEPRRFQCVAIQDLDTLPELGAGVDFADCPLPTQLSSEIECYGWLPPYAYNAGGVVTMSSEHWHIINGFSNEYEGWGGEDDDLRHRMNHLGLLQGTCMDFCNLTDRAFRDDQTDLIRRPPRGRGRFVCLDEKSHTPRKHGNMASMQWKLQEMEIGSDRWAYDGLSSLRFDLLRHTHGPFPWTDAYAELHWLKVVPSAQLRFAPDRLRLVLAEGACSPECVARKRCAASPSQLPFSTAELLQEFRHVLGDCIVRNSSDSLGYWLIDRRIIATAVDVPDSDSSDDNDMVAAHSWALSEALREGLSAPADGEPVLVARAVPVPALRASLARLRANLSRQQAPLVSVCVGVYALEDWSLGNKHTVNVGSDDCEQRSWTHLASFKALRRPRSPADLAVCIGEADGVWTARVALSTNCSGEALGITWRHKDVFYVDNTSTGKEMCVRHKVEKGPKAQWSRWQIIPRDDGGCGRRYDGYRTDFRFRSAEDSYEPLRQYVCAVRHAANSTASSGTFLRLQLGCDPSTLRAPAGAFAVLRSAALATPHAEEFCIGRSDLGDRIGKGPLCAGNFDGAEYEHVAAFAVPTLASGRPWCVGRCSIRLEGSGNGASDPKTFVVEPRSHCGGTAGCEHVLGFREVALEEMTENDGLLHLRSI